MKIQSVTPERLSNKLTAIYCLNASDIFFTFILLKTGMFYEANQLMQNIVQDVLLSILIKLLLPALIILYILYKMDELPEKSIPFCNFAINIVIVVYTGINLLHLFYSGLFLRTLL